MAIFGRRRFDYICKQFDLHFRNEPSYIEAFYEFQAFGLYSIIDWVRTQCGHGHSLRAEILTSLNERFADISGPNWEMMRLRVAEYEESGKAAPNGGLAARRIFARPPGVFQPSSMEAFELSHNMNSSYLDAGKVIGGLFKQYKFE